MNYRITGLSPEPFRRLFEMSDADLSEKGVLRTAVTEPNIVPDRIELRDALPGETVLLLNHNYLETNNPYRGSHAIYVRQGAERAYDAVNAIPSAIRTRLISLRAFDANNMIVDADVAQGDELETLIDRFLSYSNVAFLHAHHARRGCYAARVDRV